MATRTALPDVKRPAFLSRPLSLRKLFARRADRDIPRPYFFRRGSPAHSIGRRLRPSTLANREHGEREPKLRRAHCEHSHRSRLSTVERYYRRHESGPCPRVHSNISQSPLVSAAACPVRPYSATSAHTLSRPTSSADQTAYVPSGRPAIEARPRPSSLRRQSIFPRLGSRLRRTTRAP